MELYKKVEATTNIPWYYLAAIDQYERNLRQVRRDLPKAESAIGIYFRPEEWVGIGNPDPADENPVSIQFLKESELMEMGTERQESQMMKMFCMHSPISSSHTEQIMTI